MARQLAPLGRAPVQQRQQLVGLLDADQQRLALPGRQVHHPLVIGHGHEQRLLVLAGETPSGIARQADAVVAQAQLGRIDRGQAAVPGGFRVSAKQHHSSREEAKSNYWYIFYIL